MVPGMPISASAGGGGPSGSSSNAGVGTPISNPFNFDGSGWNVIFGDGNTTTASGNKDANATAQTPSAAPSGVLGGLLGGGITPEILLIGLAVYLVMKRR